jgi:RNA polymerase sigma-B factor
MSDPIVVEVPVSTTAPARARAGVSRLLVGAPPDRRLDVMLLVTELVTNSVRHGGLGDTDEIRVDVWPSAAAIRVAVVDEGSGFSDPDRMEEATGWGLRLVDRVADRWGFDSGARTTVWFEIDLADDLPTTTVDEPDAALFVRMGTDRAARDVLFERHRRIASHLARRFTGRGEDLQDLEQVASMGLLKALERFDTGHGAAFSTYASATILGELKRHLRDKAWSVRVPRGLKEASLEVSRVAGELTQKLGRVPSVADLAKESGLDEEQVLEALQAGDSFTSVSINAPAGDDDSLQMLDRLGAEDPGLGLAERWQPVAAVIGKLPERERRILYLRFYEDMTQSEIAAVIGISQMHVSRLLSGALALLRSLTEADRSETEGERVSDPP